MNRICSFFMNDLLFLCSLLIALISCFFGEFSLESVDFKVIICLFGLMLLVANIEKLGILNYIAIKLIDISSNSRVLIRNITLLSLFSSMLLTNDVAILSLMPIYLTITKKIPNMHNKITGAVLLIIAANLGSSFFPFGNPQNLFLFSYYSLTTIEFFRLSFILLFISIIFLIVSFMGLEKKLLINQEETLPPLDKRKIIYLILISLIVLAGVFDVLAYYIAIPIAVFFLFIYDSSSLKKVDYRILATFLFFFIAVGNFAQLEVVSVILKKQFTTNSTTFVGSIVLSQVISNVPAAILIAPFTNQVQALFWGVNVGGLGTIIASLANLIGFRIYKQYYPSQSKQFLLKFSILNLIFLIAFLVIFCFIL
ncbi:SLC13 family permease [Enterococcus sp. 5H]|uniref:SLC13 family permease n=1 Tax=Enterococcus sp. 5H TaxID=1229490 RepID=UPI002303245A|nr:SLC13 family permease [Enterococcus sp. 5H]MDA9470705.1 Di- and tricarboxylate transporter [Enterococcus sp. 5H]